METSNLSSAFQRMAQEPKSKQRGADKIYELVVLNHTFLASLASLSTYIQHYKTTEASEEFKIATEKIEKNLERLLQCLKDKKCNPAKASSENNPLFEEQLPTFNSLEINNLASRDKETIRDLQEAHLVWEQLQWLFSISSKMLKLAV
ncbi:MAG: hypothetical protein DHS20C13_27670 [Thermodesulfobacteriota bacterium]|nr:MAG: hypothetical protein DHS20C13_27670 [Thermodesulfobacteriota bacterium]